MATTLDRERNFIFHKYIYLGFKLSTFLTNFSSSLALPNKVNGSLKQNSPYKNSKYPTD